MTDPWQAVRIAQARERLRQESELFDQKKRQDQANHRVRVAMGWAAIPMLFAIYGLYAHVFPDPRGAFDATTVAAATCALLAIWRVTLGKGPAHLKPTTAEPELPAPTGENIAGAVTEIDRGPLLRAATAREDPPPPEGDEGAPGERVNAG